jgi:TonB family protein
MIFKILKDGKMENLLISKSSGVALVDQAALNAVESAQPFAQLPSGAPSDIVIEFTLDYNVSGSPHNESPISSGGSNADAFSTGPDASTSSSNDAFTTSQGDAFPKSKGAGVVTKGESGQ